MNEFCLHPHVYASGPHKNLLHMLEELWVRSIKSGEGTVYIISGFANYNGGVRFYDIFREHTSKGGKVKVILGGSTAQKLSSKQVVEELLKCGANVKIVNRKKILHAKCYGYQTRSSQGMVVSSGNFTGNGMSQNVESSLMLDSTTVNSMGFSWTDLVDNVDKQKWDVYLPSLSKRTDPSWDLLYDEFARDVILDETEEMSLILILGHADTARVMTEPGVDAAKGSQYFWLSKDCFDFFPPLTVRNKRGDKATYSTLITLDYIDLGETDNECRVTFEAENNFDFRIGTGKLRYSKLAKPGDIAIISRIKESEYELRIIKEESLHYKKLAKYAINFIGHQGKKYGYIPNSELRDILHIVL